MQDNRNALRIAAGVALVAASGLMSGCIASPTYGTDKTANAQLMSDVSGIMSFSDKKRAPIDYAPRPNLVKPVKGDTALPAPQENVVANNASWPESPEQRLARLRADADANADNPNYQSSIVADQAISTKIVKSTGSPRADESGIRDVSKLAAERAEFQKRVKETQQGSSTNRKFLSEPPVEYREAYADAPSGELGEDEYRKERRLKREARKKKDWGWDDLNPF